MRTAPQTERVVTVLVVEDERLVRLAIRHYLEKCGYRVVEARDRDEALAHVAGQDVDVLLTDVVLPGVGGGELAREITRECPSVRVLYMSAHPRELLRHTGQVSSDSATLQKPFTEATLIGAVRALLS